NVNNPPSQPSDIDSITIIFPNLSYLNGGGGLYSGDKVFLGSFPANTVVGWVLIAQGWNQGLNTVDNGAHIVYSDPQLNPETADSLKQHNVLLFDQERGLVLIGFEDIKRDQANCDNDFNDAVFYITASDINCIDNEDTVPINEPPVTDIDGDGIPDDIDDFPTDPNLAFCAGVPAVNVFGTMAFEDNWPASDDYDYNDLILDYNLKHYINASNQVVETDFTFIIRAAGSIYENGFGVELPISSAEVASVSGYSHTGNYITLDANGTEAGHSSKAVIIPFDNIRGQVIYTNESLMNTQRGIPPLVYDTTTVKVVYTTPLAFSALSNGPYNPFLIADGERGREVHIKNNTPTDLADTSLFGTGDDASQPGQGLYYQNANGIPWIVTTPIQMDYPFEGIDITNAHLLFSVWAQSGGTLSQNWYEDNPAFRVQDNIYRPFGISKR
ncbi:MAG: LruC domain-containing protein, partial [Calditrichota bacterium]